MACKACDGTGFCNGAVCSCITGKSALPKELRDIFGDIFSVKVDTESDVVNDRYPDDDAESVYVSLTEEMVLNPSAMPTGLEKWRQYRIEYGGHAESCVVEKVIYLPRCADAYVLDMLFDFWQAEDPDEMESIVDQITNELRRGIRRGKNAKE